MFCSFWSYIVVHGVPLGVLGPHVEPCIFSALPAARSFPGVPLSAQSNTGCPPWLIHSSLTNRPKHTISLALLHKPARADHELGRNDTLLFLCCRSPELSDSRALILLCYSILRIWRPLYLIYWSRVMAEVQILYQHIHFCSSVFVWSLFILEVTIQEAKYIFINVLYKCFSLFLWSFIFRFVRKQ